MTAALAPGRPFTGSEREGLDNSLDLNRGELVRAVESLAETQARMQLVPSLTTPISLIKHSAAAERKSRCRRGEVRRPGTPGRRHHALGQYVFAT
jgi:Protein of unknown function (DUF664)